MHFQRGKRCSIIIAARMIPIPAQCHVVKSQNVQNAVGANLDAKKIAKAKNNAAVGQSTAAFYSALSSRLYL